MANEIHREVGHGLDGSVRFTIGIIIGLLVIISGIGLIFFGWYILGIPLLLLGIIVPAALQLGLSKQRR